METNAAAQCSMQTASPSSFGGNDYSVNDSTVSNEYNFTAGSKHTKKQTQTTPARPTTATTSTTTGSWSAADSELQQVADADRWPIGLHRDALPLFKTASMSRSVGTEEIRTAEAMTATEDYDQVSPSCVVDQLQQSLAASNDYEMETAVRTSSIATAAGSRDQHDDDVTAVMRNATYRT